MGEKKKSPWGCLLWGLKGKDELGVVLWKREMRMSRDAAAYEWLAGTSGQELG